MSTHPDTMSEHANIEDATSDPIAPGDPSGGSGLGATPCSLSEDPGWGELKLALNEAIWTKAPGTTTLEQAEHAACLAIGYLNKCFEANAKDHTS